jgi:hypothetical protein
MAAGGDPRTRRRPSPAFRRSPPALYAALFSPPQRSVALEVRRAGAGRDGQRDCPMKAPPGQRGREGAGLLSCCKGQAPARGLILSPLLAPEAPRPAWLPGARRPPTRIHCTLWPGGDGAPWLLPSQPALLFQVRRAPTSMPLSRPSPYSCHLRPRGHLCIKQNNEHKEHGIWGLHRLWL